MVAPVDFSSRYEQLNDIGVALSSETDLRRLLERILRTAKAITRADGGTLYLISEDRRWLHFEIVRTDSLNLSLGGVNDAPTSRSFNDLPLYRADGTPNTSLVAAYCALTTRTVNIADAYHEAGFDFSGTRDFDRITGYRSKSFLTVPMKDHENEVIGVLQLINAIGPETGAVGIFSEADQRLAESLASQAAVALNNRRLIDQLEGLFESFISLINLAIDEKSRYTGDHCQRVPALTMMLAEAVSSTEQGPFADFRLSEKDRHELKIAGLLHDCGKVTTPVHIVDKATKLQTIWDRIDLVEARFEIIRRDAELSLMRALLAGDNEQEARRTYQEHLAGIEEDRAFLVQVNQGCELMRSEDQERVRQISRRYRWLNSAGEEVDFLSDDELENLNIRHGTLTTAERERVNHHVVATIRMLEALPWPKHLKNVPEYAGGHHERVDGRGYPRGLARDQMSVPARIMGIADIFEAVTARDRPYKPGMRLSDALRVMEGFVREGHIDADLYQIFVQSKIYLRYARAYLDPDQIDVKE